MEKIFQQAFSDLPYFPDSGSNRRFISIWIILWQIGPVFYLFHNVCLVTAFLFLCNVSFIFSITKKHLVHFIPYLLILTYSFSVFYLGKNIFPEKTGRYNLQLLGIFFNAQVLAYNLAILYNFRKYLSKLKQEYSLIDQTANNWIKISVIGFLLACIIVQIDNYIIQFHLFTGFNWYIPGNAAFLLFFIILFYTAIIKPDLIRESQMKEKYKYSSLSTSEANKILAELDNCMKEKKPFTDAALSLKALSKMVNIHERHVSQVINEYKNQNFFDYVNYHRIQFAMEMLKDKNNIKKTMLDILFYSGFNSKSSFNTAFKKYSGFTPTDFRKIHS